MSGTEEKPSADDLVDFGEENHRAGRLQEAEAYYRKALEIDAGHPGALYYLANMAYDDGRLALALQLAEALLRDEPNDAEAWHLLGMIAFKNENLSNAIECLQKALAIQPAYAQFYLSLGSVLSKQGELDVALTNYNKALTLNPDYAEAYNNRGIVLSDLKRWDEALNNYDRAISLKPDFVEAHINRGNVLNVLKRSIEALNSYDSAIASKPDSAEAYNNRGNALNDLKRTDEALASYGKAVALKPDYAEAYNNFGNALNHLKRTEEALTSYGKAIALKPDYAEAYNNRGNALKSLRRWDEALSDYDTAIALKPDYAEAYNNRGSVLNDLKRLDEALNSYQKAIELKPDYEFLFGILLHTKMLVCDWQELDRHLEKYETDIRASKKITPPWAALALLDSPELHRQAAKIFVDAVHPPMEHLGAIEKKSRNEKIRIGYYSADFYNHATAFLMAELFESHDSTKFELFGFSFGPNKKDEMQKRVSSAFAHFFDVSDKSDRDIARHSRELGIDIAIDLKGFTADSRTGIFAERCAPIQVNYLGYPGTMSATYIDYIVADATVIPKENRSNYTEKVVYLPHSYQVNDSKRRISAQAYTRQELGLPVSGFVFCCFNNNYKILPSTFDVWMRILNAVKDSVLWLFEDNSTAAKNLRKEAESRGVDSSRLIFAKRLPLEEHLARQCLADLFIDTFPCNAHTTASDALWAELPVLTCAGKSFASRVAASLLNAIELPELIASTQEEYETKAIELATNPEKLRDIKLKLTQNIFTTPLFNAKLFAKHIESAYAIMYERYQAGLAPDCIEIIARE